ncbi:DUF2306 domain-containing protein [Danxiaibacter flavus]|uniref:DUF2306 domain-containing protein n=1 Tax=Danxiaibacter flavus TaxID=3049108 RepID=A0ABV3ZH55_9BACT|nr:DUF2306 domain-containing protein [Chitinophagaceae bacterium DXS]
MGYSSDEITLHREVQKEPRGGSARFLYGTGLLLVSTVWVSAGLFGLYILAFYAAALYNGHLAKWNQILPGLYQENASAATTGIGLHFAMGGIILVLGSIQLISKIRNRWPAFHRWAGRVYITACIFAAIGGLIFIAAKGTIGGPVMNTGFALYGVLMLLAAIEAWLHGVARRIEMHRAWAIRLYALAIGSWLYRMDYGFWLLLADGAGHLKNFRGPFDYTMAFFFYLPNLLVAEIFIRNRRSISAPVLNIVSAFALLLMTAFLILGTYYFTKFYWGPAIIDWLT